MHDPRPSAFRSQRAESEQATRQSYCAVFKAQASATAAELSSSPAWNAPLNPWQLLKAQLASNTLAKVSFAPSSAGRIPGMQVQLQEVPVLRLECAARVKWIRRSFLVAQLNLE